MEDNLKNDRFFSIILLGIGILVLISIILVVANRQEMAYQLDDSPEGVVNNYITAWYEEDYDKIAGYLMDAEYKPDYQAIVRNAYDSQYSLDTTSIRVEKSTIREDEATVMIIIIQQPNDPFSSTSQSSDIVSLKKQEGEWKISQFPYPYWGWDWYQSESTINK
jgi:hypothetical protein